ncbi:MAG: putative zinc-finger [Pseudomonadota bacterium]|jgi:anti-sigma factor RsiW
MNGEHLSTQQLQRGHDGELPEQEATEFRLHLAACPDCQGYLDQLTRLGGLVKMAAQDMGATVAQPDFDRMFGAIERAITADAAPLITAAPKIATVRTLKTKNAWLYRGAPALGAVALAAAALLMVFRQEQLPGDATDQPSYETAMITSRSEIVAVDFGSNAGQVFDIPMTDGSSIPVVWIDDDDDEEE